MPRAAGCSNLLEWPAVPVFADGGLSQLPPTTGVAGRAWGQLLRRREGVQLRQGSNSRHISPSYPTGDLCVSSIRPRRHFSARRGARRRRRPDGLCPGHQSHRPRHHWRPLRRRSPSIFRGAPACDFSLWRASSAFSDMCRGPCTCLTASAALET